MITLEVNDKKYFIPNNLSELTIEKYQQVHNISEKVKGIKRLRAILNIFCDITDEEFNVIDSTTGVEIVNNITLMLSKYDNELIRDITVDGTDYTFQKNLDTLRMDQYIDLMEMTDTDGNMVNNLHLITSILYHKVISENNIYDIED